MLQKTFFSNDLIYFYFCKLKLILTLKCWFSLSPVRANHRLSHPGPIPVATMLPYSPIRDASLIIFCFDVSSSLIIIIPIITQIWVSDFGRYGKFQLEGFSIYYGWVYYTCEGFIPSICFFSVLCVILVGFNDGRALASLTHMHHLWSYKSSPICWHYRWRQEGLCGAY